MGIAISRVQMVVFVSRFSPGTIVATPNALEALKASGEDAKIFLDRHLAGDWGEVCEEDRRENEESIRLGFRIVSVYHTALREKLYVITEADRSATTLLLAWEY